MKTILLIEDNTDINETTCEILELAGFKLITAKNGKQGVSYALKNQTDVILCDIWMPEMDGYEVLKTIKRTPKNSTTPFIFISARTEPKDINMGLEMGAIDYICKPFTEQELLEVVNQSLICSEVLL